MLKKRGKEKGENMEDEDRKLVAQLAYLIVGGGLCAYAMSLGYDGYLALVAVVALFGGKEVLAKFLGKGE